jgi:integrase
MAAKVTQKSFEKILREGEEKLHNLGDKLYLAIKGNSKDFYFRYTRNKKTRKFSLKAYHPKTNTLGDARKKAIRLNAMLAEGLDPHEERQKKINLENNIKVQKKIADNQKENTFSKCAYDYIAANESSWTNIKTAAQWRSSLEQYAFPVIGSTPVGDITKSQILAILEPIWFDKTETADRVRRRIATILDVAISDGHRNSRNPANWRGSLQGKLPNAEAQKKAQKPNEERSHASLHYSQLAEFMKVLSLQDGIGARALEFCILNANRTSEVLGATWDELNLEEGVWSIPARRMKGRERHTIPLSKQSQELIKRLYQIRVSPFVFPNLSSGKSLSQAGMSSVIKRIFKDKEWRDIYGRPITVHGFRGTFRTWAAEKTDADWLTGEMALAHKIKDKAASTYLKGELMEKRLRLSQSYSDFALELQQDNSH